MFIELNSANRKTGWIEVVCGSMFSGKTEELIRRLRRAEIANLNVAIFKPTIDARYSKKEIVSHNKNSIHSQPISSSSEIMQLIEDIDVVGLDEAQFFDDGIVDVCQQMANLGIRVIVAGLDMDFKGNPFGPMPALLACAELVTKVHAICQRCGSLANYSYRLNSEAQQILVGEKNAYEPRCRTCFFLDLEEEENSSITQLNTP